MFSELQATLASRRHSNTGQLDVSTWQSPTRSPASRRHSSSTAAEQSDVSTWQSRTRSPPRSAASLSGKAEAAEAAALRRQSSATNAEMRSLEQAGERRREQENKTTANELELGILAARRYRMPPLVPRSYFFCSPILGGVRSCSDQCLLWPHQKAAHSEQPCGRLFSARAGPHNRQAHGEYRVH